MKTRKHKSAPHCFGNTDNQLMMMVMNCLSFPHLKDNNNNNNKSIFQQVIGT